MRKFCCIYQIAKEVDFFQLKRSYNPFNKTNSSLPMSYCVRCVDRAFVPYVGILWGRLFSVRCLLVGGSLPVTGTRAAITAHPAPALCRPPSMFCSIVVRFSCSEASDEHWTLFTEQVCCRAGEPDRRVYHVRVVSMSVPVLDVKAVSENHVYASLLAYKLEIQML